MMANVADDYSDSSDYDTDEELKEAFAAGLIKPGLNYMGEAPEEKVAKNNVPAMKQKLAELSKNMPWVSKEIFNICLCLNILICKIETLEMVNTPAPLAPELAMKEDLHGKEREKKLKSDKVNV